MINYEREIEDSLLAEMSHMYGVKDVTALYRYVYIRYLCSLMISKRSAMINEEMERGFISFIIKELNLELIDNRIYYLDQEISRDYSPENSLRNIMDNWKFKAWSGSVYPAFENEEALNSHIIKTYGEILKASRGQVKKYRKDTYYEVFLMDALLSELNYMFGTDCVQAPKRIDGYRYTDRHMDMKLSMEERNNRYIHLAMSMSMSVWYISEEELEDFVVKNLSLIEEGLEYQGRQISVCGGRIDVLAKDVSGRYAVIELKVAPDKQIVWQSYYYREQIGELYGADNVRFISVLPEPVPLCLKKPLLKNRDAEIIEYIPIIEFGALKGLKCRKLA